MEEGLVRGHIEHDQQRQAPPSDLDMPRFAPPDAALQGQFTLVLADQHEQRRLRRLLLRSGRAACRPRRKRSRASRYGRQQHLQLRPHALEVLQVVQAGQQTSARLEFLVQRVAVQLIEVMLAELAEEIAGRRQHAGDRKHEHQAQPRGERQPDHGASGSSSM